MTRYAITGGDQVAWAGNLRLAMQIAASVAMISLRGRERAPVTVRRRGSGGDWTTVAKF